MAPFTTAKNTGALSDADRDRFAVCFLHIADYLSIVDWDAAAADFDAKVKVASFKTQVGRARKKILEGEGGSDASGVKPKAKAKGAGKGKGKGKAGAKRKAPSDEEDEEGMGEEEEPKKKKAKGGKKGKKEAEVHFEEEDDDDDDEGEVGGHDVGAVVKDETLDDGLGAFT